MFKLRLLLFTLGVGLAIAFVPSVSLAQKGKRTAETFKQLQAEETDAKEANEAEEGKGRRWLGNRHLWQWLLLV